MVLIKGMEMSENCRNCVMTVNENYEGLYCQITGKYCPNEERSNDCPLISVDSVIEQMKTLHVPYVEPHKGRWDKEVIAANKMLNDCIEMLRGLED